MNIRSFFIKLKLLYPLQLLVFLENITYNNKYEEKKNINTFNHHCCRSLILETCILKYVNDKNAQTTSNVLLDRVIAVIDKNESSKSEFVKSLKDDYIVRAKAISYIVDAKPEVEYDVDELQKIAGLMQCH